MGVSNTSDADLEMIAGNCQMRAVLPQLCLVAHILCSLPDVLTHQQNHDIHQRLGAILAEEVGTPVQYLLLKALMDRYAVHKAVQGLQWSGIHGVTTGNIRCDSDVGLCHVQTQT